MGLSRARIVLGVRLRAPDVRQRVDEKRDMVTYHQPQDAGKQEHTKHVARSPSRAATARPKFMASINGR